FGQLPGPRAIDLAPQPRPRGRRVPGGGALSQLTPPDEARGGFPSLSHVQPPLRTKADREALREAVKNGVVQAIASHHQPHEADAKNAPFAATEPGISGAELLLPLA
ncbi:dihydroorotase, partial [Pseudomonas aeruginosa]|nr:dihydroorotase [Pseudomonas aeruginosa]